jgi:predicted cobalt transporter CbtA
MWAVGYLVAPVLFSFLTDKVLAGALAAKLFSTMSYVGIFCAVYLLAYINNRAGKLTLKQGVFWIVVLMLIITLLGQLGMQPLLAELKTLALPQSVMESPYADRFKFWHGVSSIAFLLQSILGAVLLLKLPVSKKMIQ